jgi:hypothetical protein
VGARSSTDFVELLHVERRSMLPVPLNLRVAELFENFDFLVGEH